MRTARLEFALLMIMVMPALQARAQETAVEGAKETRAAAADLAPTAPGERVEAPSVDAFVGEVTANDVYVRSGPSANYYTVMKAHAGQRVLVHRQEDGWYKITPPPGCFSVVHKQFVDMGTAEGEGVINGDAVFVRAGTETSDLLYAKQMKLARGAVVRVLGPHNDDYLRIAPPDGAHLYIHSQYVQIVPGADPASINQPVVPSGASFTGVPGADAVGDAGAGSGEVGGGASGQATGTEARPRIEPGKFRVELDTAEAALKGEMEKPARQRDYASLVEKYRALADQKVDPLTSKLALVRVEQLEHAAQAVGELSALRGLAEDFSIEREKALRARSEVRAPERSIGGGFDAVGELRPSMLYDSPVTPRRYRLVDPDSQSTAPRTIAYVEIPLESGIDAERFLGRHVGVRAKETRLQTGDVDPITIYVATELVALDAGTTEAAPPAGSGR